MEISQAAAKRILGEIQAKVSGPVNMTCPFCDEITGWNLDPTIYQVLPYAGGGLTIGGPVFPALLLTCKNCGHVEVLSALFWKALDSMGRPSLV